MRQQFITKGVKRDLSSDDEAEEQWLESFCSESTKNVKSSQLGSSSSQQKEHESERGSSSQPKEDESKNDDDEDDAKSNFYVKVGKNKKFKYM